MSKPSRTYTVWIRREGNQWIARDKDNDWRAKGSAVADNSPKQICAGLATWLFHKEEVASTMIGTDCLICEIYDYGPYKQEQEASK